jgi:hypothetical protein
MKSTGNVLRGVLRSGGKILAAALALCCAVSADSLKAATLRSPVGPTWDCTISGNGEQGIAYFNFYDDFSFQAYRFLVPKPGKGRFSNPRSESPTDSRTFASGTGSTPSDMPQTNLFGRDFDTGTWGYDERGRIIGTFLEVLGHAKVVTTTNENTVTTTNEVVTPVINPNDGSTNYFTNQEVITFTNTTVTITTNFPATNGISFVGTVVPERRIALKAYVPGGTITYVGGPVKTTLPDLSGPWYSARIETNQTFIDTFTLFKDPVFVNVYNFTNGTAANYTYQGAVALSSTRKIAFAFATFPLGSTNYLLGATYGSLSGGKSFRKADTRGVEESTGDGNASLRIKAVQLLP